jgi:hypothetical protein
VEFRRAYEMTGNYKMLYNVAQTEYELQDYAGALKSFQRYLEAGGTEIEAGRRAEVEDEVKSLGARVAHLKITSNVDGAEVLIDDVLVGKTPLAEPVLVSIGRRKVTLQKDGTVSAPRVVELAGGDSTALRVDLGRAPAATPAPTAPAAPPSRAGLWASLAVTGGLAVGTGIVGGLALGAHADAEKKLGTLGSTAPEIEAARSKTQTLALVADILGGTTIAMAGVTLILGLTTTGKSDAPAPPKAAVTVGPRGVSLVGTF